MLKDGLWYHHDLGHCSCYGPTENIELVRGFATIGSLLENCSEGLRKDLECLVPAKGL
jgi:hypothetical protein